MNKIIDGKSIAEKVKNTIKNETNEMYIKYGKKPHLAVIIVGDDQASKVYVRSKEKACKEMGFDSSVYRFDSAKEEDILSLIDKLNVDESISGILVQLPLPKHINEKKVINRISVLKDVDGFNILNVGKLSVNEKGLVPCTPLGIMEMMKEIGIDVTGLDCTIIGRSNIVGKPMARLLENSNATVTICHSKTKDLIKHTKDADLIVVAIGKPKFIKKEMVKDGSIIIDVGINRVDGKIVGDVDFDDVYDKVKYITPVPGGVGPMTIAMLMKNTLECFKAEVEK